MPVVYTRNENSLWKTFLFLLCHIIRLIVLGQWKLQRPFLESYNMCIVRIISIVSHIYDAGERTTSRWNENEDAWNVEEPSFIQMVLCARS